jgi:hypothetical protein
LSGVDWSWTCGVAHRKPVDAMFIEPLMDDRVERAIEIAPLGRDRQGLIA